MDLRGRSTNAVEELGRSWTSGGHTLAVDLPADPLRHGRRPGPAGPGRRQPAANAAKYTDPGGKIVVTATLQKDEGERTEG